MKLKKLLLTLLLAAPCHLTITTDVTHQLLNAIEMLAILNSPEVVAASEKEEKTKTLEENEETAIALQKMFQFRQSKRAKEFSKIIQHLSDEISELEDNFHQDGPTSLEDIAKYHELQAEQLKFYGEILHYYLTFKPNSDYTSYTAKVTHQQMHDLVLTVVEWFSDNAYLIPFGDMLSFDGNDVCKHLFGRGASKGKPLNPVASGYDQHNFEHFFNTHFEPHNQSFKVASDDPQVALEVVLMAQHILKKNPHKGFRLEALKKQFNQIALQDKLNHLKRTALLHLSTSWTQGLPKPPADPKILPTPPKTKTHYRWRAW